MATCAVVCKLNQNELYGNKTMVPVSFNASYAARKGYCQYQTANLLQSSADDFLLHVNFEWLIIRPVRPLQFLITLITG